MCRGRRQPVAPPVHRLGHVRRLGRERRRLTPPLGRPIPSRTTATTAWGPVVQVAHASLQVNERPNLTALLADPARTAEVPTDAIPVRSAAAQRAPRAPLRVNLTVRS